MDDDFDFTKPQTQSTGPAAAPQASAPFKPAVSKFYDPVVAMRLFQAAGRAEKIAAGETLFVEHERSGKQGLFGKRVAHRMYFLGSGEVALSAGGRSLDTLRAGEIFGEMAVISETAAGSARSATALAKTDCEVLSLDGAELQAALQGTPEFALMLMSVMFDRLRFVAARLAMRKSATGTRSGRDEVTFSPELLRQLDDALQHATTVRFAAGSPIMREGEAGVSMYVVMEGKVSITIRNSEVELVQAGGTFGEMALVDQSPRTASATAQSDCILLSVNRSALLALVRSQPAIGIAMLRSVADRLRHMNGLLA
ncbi:MAG: cyclic nucleotide-binding domain-containing protein [Burkholderiales bacterium]|nr:cyclic nucleotide-binding domain-containing protein [Burkholderiales bacterium]